ncbi:MAG TPA: hypothetical protein VIH78_05405 [Terriglobales bacterium]
MSGTEKPSAILAGMFGVLILAFPSGVLIHAGSSSLGLGLNLDMQSSVLPAPGPTQDAPQQAAPVYPQTQDGFADQISAAFQAFQKGDTFAGRQQLEQLRLPRSSEWFAERFSAEQSEALAKRYDRLFENYVNRMQKELDEIARTKGRQLKMSLKPGTQEQPTHDKLSSLKPAKEIVCFNADFGVTLTGKKPTIFGGDYKFEAWEDTFVYQDGAFRFVGRGAWPFWVFDDKPQEKPSADAAHREFAGGVCSVSARFDCGNRRRSNSLRNGQSHGRVEARDGERGLRGKDGDRQSYRV